MHPAPQRHEQDLASCLPPFGRVALLGPTDDEPSGVRMLLAARHVEGCTNELLCGEAGEFLTQLARGEDAGWTDGSLAHRHEMRTRSELIALLGSGRKANALLRAMTRDGRLHPGLTPPLGTRVVNSERGQVSSLEEYNEALLPRPSSFDER